MKKRYALLGWCLAGLGLVCAAQAGEVINPGFETGDLTGWTTFGGGWRTSGWVGDEFSDFHRGTMGAVCDVDIRKTNEWRVLSQEIAVQEGGRYSGGAWVRATAVQSSESYVELQFLDANTNVLEHFQSPHVQADQGFTFMALDGVEAPKGARTVRLSGIVHVTGQPTDRTEFHVFDDFALGTMLEMNSSRP